MSEPWDDDWSDPGPCTFCGHSPYDCPEDDEPYPREINGGEE